MIAITTEVTKGGKVKVTGSRGRMFCSFDGSISAEENHDTAATCYMNTAGWGGVWVRGSLPTGGFVYVPLDRMRDSVGPHITDAFRASISGPTRGGLFNAEIG